MLESSLPSATVLSGDLAQWDRNAIQRTVRTAQEIVQLQNATKHCNNWAVLLIFPATTDQDPALMWPWRREDSTIIQVYRCTGGYRCCVVSFPPSDCQLSYRCTGVVVWVSSMSDCQLSYRCRDVVVWYQFGCRIQVYRCCSVVSVWLSHTGVQVLFCGIVECSHNNLHQQIPPLSSLSGRNQTPATRDRIWNLHSLCVFPALYYYYCCCCCCW